MPRRAHWRAGPRALLTSQEQFEGGVAAIRECIAAGDVLQVNLTRREEAAFEGDNDVEDAGRRAWLAASIKDRAENLMIVDLMRNDLGRVAATGSVRAPELFALEPYPNVWQRVSTVTARLKTGIDRTRLLRACWPPGSMTGAPMVKAMELIDQLEPTRRGWYAGSIGYLSVTGHMDLSVVIRTAVVADRRVMVQFGGGIVADSEPPNRAWNGKKRLRKAFA